MLQEANALTPDQLAAIAELEQAVVAHDGGRLKLEWPTLRARSGRRPEDVLAYDGSALVGFAGLYAFGGADVEVAGMVHPGHRRRGTGTALLEAAAALCRERGRDRMLLVTPRATPAGAGFARRHGGALDHSEHHLVLHGPPPDREPDPAVTMRAATADDIPALERLLRSGFDWEPDRHAIEPSEDGDRTLIVERDGGAAGTLRVGRDGDTASVYGFTIDAELRGRGIGRDVLSRVCRDAFETGARRVTLEVEVDNDRALELYLSVGFVREATEDYFALDLT